MSAPHRVVVIGGGVAGLATGWLIDQQARQRGIQIALQVLEASAEPGGHTRTDVVDGFTCEWGSNGYLDNEPATLDLIDQLGMGDRVLAADQRAAKRFVYHSGQMHELPTKPGAFLLSDIVSVRDKARMALELAVPAKQDGLDETVYDFGRRRLGEGFADYLLDPMVSGIFAGNTRELSLAAVFPKMVALEQDYGGLFRALFAKGLQRLRGGGATGGGPAGPAGALHTFRDGMGELTTKLAVELGALLRTDAPVVSLGHDGGSFSVHLTGDTLEADAVVLACPAHAATDIVADLSGPTARALGEIPFAPVSVACQAIAVEQLARPLEGFGVLVPRSEGQRSLGTLCSDRIFTGQAPAGMRLLRTLVGGAHDPSVVQLSEAELLACVDADLDTLFGLRGRPQALRCYRHERAIAQYTVGHLDRVAVTERLEAELPRLSFTGASYRGVSVNACIKDAFRVADRVLAQLDGDTY